MKEYIGVVKALEHYKVEVYEDVLLSHGDPIPPPSQVPSIDEETL